MHRPYGKIPGRTLGFGFLLRAVGSQGRWQAGRRRDQICFLEGTSGNSRRRQWYPTPVLLPGKSHGWRSLVGCSPWGLKESDTTERLHFHFSLSCIGEGNGNPLQCSCLKNPRDVGLWLWRGVEEWASWAAVSGVAQNRT